MRVVPAVLGFGFPASTLHWRAEGRSLGLRGLGVLGLGALVFRTVGVAGLAGLGLGGGRVSVLSWICRM